MSPEEIIRRLKELLNEATVCSPGTGPKLTVEYGHLLEFTVGVLQNMVAEIKKLKEPKT